MKIHSATNDSVSETYAQHMAGVAFADIPNASRTMVINELIDSFGLIIAARGSEYVRQVMASCDANGLCSVPGQRRRLGPAGAALVNGTAIHGEDFDDTLEGSPVRVAAAVVPAVLAASEQHRLTGEDFMRGVAVGLETICRINLVSPGEIRKRCFHPAGVIGAFGAAAGVCAALGAGAGIMASALGIAGSFSSGLMEYLEEEAWTKRLHPGWAAQAGYRAARLAQQGFVAPRRIFEGENGFFQAFASGAAHEFRHLTEGLGNVWQLETIALKPYACGTMIHPYVDCMVRLAAEGRDPKSILSIVCETSEQAAQRLWEPLAVKQTPEDGYTAKFSAPWCMAMAYHAGQLGLGQFGEELIHKPEVVELSKKISHVIDPNNPYPARYTGHIRVQFNDGTERELWQPHIRGGANKPLPRDELIRKYNGNIAYGGWMPLLGQRLLDFILDMPSHRDLAELRLFSA